MVRADNLGPWEAQHGLMRAIEPPLNHTMVSCQASPSLAMWSKINTSASHTDEGILTVTRVTRVTQPHPLSEVVHDSRVVVAARKHRADLAAMRWGDMSTHTLCCVTQSR